MILKYVFSSVLIVSGFTTFVYGYASFEKFNFTPGAQVSAPAQLPVTATQGLLDEVNPTLFVFVHPECACSRATLIELRKIAEKTLDRLKIKIFYESSAKDEATAAMLADRMSGMSNTLSLADQDAELANILGAKTSGQTYLYSKSGKLLFQGGITLSRGHVGDSLGADTILSLVKNDAEVTRSASMTPTFGCGL